MFNVYAEIHASTSGKVPIYMIYMNDSLGGNNGAF
jgi:hypothetical protein